MRDEVKWFADRMEQKLRRNDGKGGWKTCNPKYLQKRIEEEFREMTDCMSAVGTAIFFHGKVSDAFIEEFIGECADIANFAMMLADLANNEWNKK